MRPLLLTLGIVLLGLAASTRAGPPQKSIHQYRWVDATGLPHYSDSLSVEALKYGYDVLNSRGVVVRHVPAAMTPAERKLADAEAAQATSTQQTALEQLRADRQLLMAYPTEALFQAAQQARIGGMQDRIHTTQMNLQSQEQSLAQLLARAADYSTQGTAIPHALIQRIAKQRQAVTDQRQLLKEEQAGKVELAKQVSTEMTHYRQLRAKQQARYGQ